MNKKLLAVAVASAMAAPLAAQADEGNVTIYGQANVSYDYIDAGNSSAGNKTSSNVSSNQSVFGIEGWEPLGNGLKAVFHWDVFAGVDDGSGFAGLNSSGAKTGTSFFGTSRDAWVGLAGSFGTVALGNQGRPWKTATNNTDIFINTIADYAGIIGTTTDHEIFEDSGFGNAIIWFGPNINGLSWHVQYTPGEQFAGSGNNNGADVGAQVNYTNGPWRLTYAYDGANRGNEPGGDDGDNARRITANKASVEYTFLGTTKIAFIYDRLRDDQPSSAASTINRDAYYFNVAHDFGNNTAKFAYAHANESDAKNDGADYFAVGLYHHFSKRTEVYALYTRINNDTNGEYGLSSGNASSASVGETNNASPANNGEDVGAFSIGMHHNF